MWGGASASVAVNKFTVVKLTKSGKQYPQQEKTTVLEIKDNEVEYSVTGESYEFLMPESNRLQDVRVM